MKGFSPNYVVNVYLIEEENLIQSALRLTWALGADWFCIWEIKAYFSLVLEEVSSDLLDRVLKDL